MILRPGGFSRRTRARASIGLISALVFTVAGCGGKPSTPEPEQHSGPHLGVSFLPRSYSPEGVAEFLSRASEAGGVVSWAGDWVELADSVNGAPAVLMALAESRHLVPVVQAQFFTQADGVLLRPLDGANRAMYKRAAAAFASRYRPSSLGFGIELNLLHEKNPGAFEDFVRFFPEVRDTVKAVSPETRVFTVFQLERMKGLGGGLFGGVNDPGAAEWPLLDRVAAADFVGFTTYPGLVFRSPEEIPPDYYEEIAVHTGKPIYLTESGWHSAPRPPGWASSDAEQAAFVDTLFTRLSIVPAEMVIWSFLSDPPAPEPFDSMGLLDGNGVPRAAWSRWITHRR